MDGVAHPIHRVKEFEVVGPYRVRIGRLRDLAVFNAVSLDREIHTLVWPNGADFDPATLHDWPEHEAAMVALARQWAEGSKGA
jgi:hypothetical protein